MVMNVVKIPGLLLRAQPKSLRLRQRDDGMQEHVQLHAVLQHTCLSFILLLLAQCTFETPREVSEHSFLKRKKNVAAAHVSPPVQHRLHLMHHIQTVRHAPLPSHRGPARGHLS